MPAIVRCSIQVGARNLSAKFRHLINWSSIGLRASRNLASWVEVEYRYSSLMVHDGLVGPQRIRGKQPGVEEVARDRWPLQTKEPLRAESAPMTKAACSKTCAPGGSSSCAIWTAGPIPGCLGRVAEFKFAAGTLLVLPVGKMIHMRWSMELVASWLDGRAKEQLARTHNPDLRHGTPVWPQQGFDWPWLPA